VALLLGVPGSAPGQQPDDAILSSWLDAHARLETWSAELVQTRHLAALTHPLISTGSVHYSRPGLFRWELGQPPDTIAIRSTNELLLVYPRLKRAERYPVDGKNGGPLRDALTLMEAGFPRDAASLQKQYRIATTPEESGHCRITLEPRSPRARKLITRVALTFNTNVFELAASEIQFADGSRLQNRFSRSASNEPQAPGLFSTNLPTGFKVVEPFNP
jgi:outer membrane lipoprotein-sorting protein